MARQNGFQDSSTPKVIIVEREAGSMCTKCSLPLISGENAVEISGSGKLHIHCYS